jgi:hypothetical protein
MKTFVFNMYLDYLVIRREKQANCYAIKSITLAVIIYMNKLIIVCSLITSLTLICVCGCANTPEEPIVTTSEYALIYVGDQLNGESAKSIGAAIGLSWWDRMALRKAIRQHERQLKKIGSSDYAPYLKGILLQTENERYRNSVMDAIGYENYCKWFDYARGGTDRKIKERYGLDDGHYEEFKRIVKQYDISLRLTKRNWISDEQKKAEIDSILIKRAEDLKPILRSDIPFTDILLRDDETKY